MIEVLLFVIGSGISYINTNNVKKNNKVKNEKESNKIDFYPTMPKNLLL